MSGEGVIGKTKGFLVCDRCAVLVFDYGHHVMTGPVNVIETKIQKIFMTTAVLEDDPSNDCMVVLSKKGNQLDLPKAGSILLKGLKPMAVGNGTPVPITLFGQAVNWLAVGV